MQLVIGSFARCARCNLDFIIRITNYGLQFILSLFPFSTNVFSPLLSARGSFRELPRLWHSRFHRHGFSLLSTSLPEREPLRPVSRLFLPPVRLCPPKSSARFSGLQPSRLKRPSRFPRHLFSQPIPLP